MRTHNIPHQYKKNITRLILTTIISAAIGILCQGLKTEFEIVAVNEPSVFEPL